MSQPWASLDSYRSRSQSLVRKIKRENRNNLLMTSKRILWVSVFVVEVWQNDTFCLNCVIGYKDFCENRFIDKFWTICDGKVDSSSRTYWCPLWCLSQGFSAEQYSCLCFRALLVKKPDLKKLSRNTLVGQILFHVFLAYILVTNYSEHILFLNFSHVLIKSRLSFDNSFMLRDSDELNVFWLSSNVLTKKDERRNFLVWLHKLLKF